MIKYHIWCVEFYTVITKASFNWIIHLLINNQTGASEIICMYI